MPVGAGAVVNGSTKTLIATNPPENTRWATGSRRPRSLRKPSMIFTKPGGMRVTVQPVSLGATSPAEASFTVQSGGTAAQVGSIIAGSTLALTVRSVNANCSTT